MDTLVTLSALEVERLLITIESSQQVQRRHQYFLWSQGALQGFLPHDILIVGYGEYDTPGFRCEVLARANIYEDRTLLREIDMLVQAMVDEWQIAGGLPRLFSADENGGNVAAKLARLGFGHALAHGMREFTRVNAGFFVFLRMPQAPSRRHAYFAEVLMPYLYVTLYRMLQAEQDAPGRRLRPGIKLSCREAEVIGLIRDGKTNQQIADTLQLSPLTVKNHVQNILRKLEVANRAQAVAKAVKARLISDSPLT